MSEKVVEMFCQPSYERAVLSFCFKSANNFYTVSSRITPDDFLRPEHRFIYLILQVLDKSGMSKFDRHLIISEAKKQGLLEMLGGYAYINAIAEMDVDTSNLFVYIDAMLDSSTKYTLYSKLAKHIEVISDKSLDDEMKSEDLISMVENDVIGLSLKSKVIKEAINVSDGIDDFIEDRKNNPIEFLGLPTGFGIFDKRIDGLVNGTLTVVCARPKTGKSTFLSTVSAHVAYMLNKPVLYVDTEMPFEQFRPRILSMLSGVPERRINKGGYTDQEYHNLKQAAKIVKQGKLYHEFMPGYSVEKINTLYKKYKHKDDIALAVFDYLKSPRGADFINKKEYQILGDLTTALKEMAGTLDIPFLVANQLNQENRSSGSDRILHYADVMSYLHVKSLEELERDGIDGGTHKLVITDSRRGGSTPEEGINLVFVKRCLSITEASVQAIDYDKYENVEKEEMNYDSNDTEGASDDDDSYFE